MSSDANTSTEQQSINIYEREVQKYLASNLSTLGDSFLKLVQTEYPVVFGRESGRIDILAQDRAGSFVVIEIKRGMAGRNAVGQLQSYMGVIQEDNPHQNVRGILVAMGLDEAAQSALRMTSKIDFFEFKIKFDFSKIPVLRAIDNHVNKLKRADCREGYWENMGGVILDHIVDCGSCKKEVKVVYIGKQHICGACGAVVHLP